MVAERLVLVCVAPLLPSAVATHAGGVVLHHRLAGLAESFDVRVLAPGTEGNRALLAAGSVGFDAVLVHPDPRPKGWRAWPKVLPAVAGRLDVFADSIRGALDDPGADVAALLGGAHIVEVHWGEYAPTLPMLRRAAPQAVLGLYLHDVLRTVRRARSRNASVRRAERWIYRVSVPWATLRERSLARCADIVFVLKESDARLVQGGDGRPPVHVARPWVDIPATATGPARAPVALFLSALWREENAMAAGWLLERVWPAVRAAVPDAELRLVGPGAPQWLAEQAAALAGVVMPGFVDDVAVEYAGARVALAPLADPSGLKIKVVQAMVLGLPVAATPAAAAGMATAPVDAWAVISGDPAAYADGVVQMLRSYEDAAAVGERAAAWARRQFDAEADIAWTVADYRRRVEEQVRGG